jgi:hypothetical protein
VERATVPRCVWAIEEDIQIRAMARHFPAFIF